MQILRLWAGVSNIISRGRLILLAAILFAGALAPLTMAVQTANASTGSWAAEYYNLNPDSGSSPEDPVGEPDYERTDANIDFDWGVESPVPGTINQDDFFVRWTRTSVYEAGEYLLAYAFDDGYRIYIDDELIRESWVDQPAVRSGRLVELSGGSHTIVVEYYDDSSSAEAHFWIGQPEGAVGVIGQNTLNTSNEHNVNPSQYGLSEPGSVAIDTFNHKLYVAEENESESNRIVVYELSGSNQLTDTEIDYVIGQKNALEVNYDCDDNIQVSARNICEPAGLAIDMIGERLFVADAENNRILVYDVSDGALETHMPASIVLGQADFTSHDCNRGDATAADTLCSPDGLHYDHPSNKLFVADAENHRVLVFDATEGNLTNGAAAENVIGQPDFETADCDVSSAILCSPSDIYYDSEADYMVVTDEHNHRVLLYDTSEGITNSMSASTVLGQPDASSDYCNYPESSVENNNMCYPQSVAFDAGTNRLYVADRGNNRVLVFSGALSTLTDGQQASAVLGQESLNGGDCNTDIDDNLAAANTLCGPSGIEFANRLFVTDTDNNRVLAYDVDSVTTGEDAVQVIGQADFIHNYRFQLPTPNGTGFDEPGDAAIDSDNHRAFIADTDNDRVLVFNLDSNDRPISNTAALVIGQPDMYTDGCMDEGVMSGAVFCNPQGVAYDSETERLFVADTGLNRVLVFDASPQTLDNHDSAINVIGQADFMHTDCNRGDNPSSQTLCAPQGLYYDETSNQLYVADTDNSRILRFAAGESMDDSPEANLVIGQSDFSFADCNEDSFAAANRLCYPNDVTYSQSTGQLLVADTENNRVTIYDPEFSNGLEAQYVIGQDDFEGEDCNTPEPGEIKRICYPSSVAVDEASAQIIIANTEGDMIHFYSLAADDLADSDGELGHYGDHVSNCDYARNWTLCNSRGLFVNQNSGDIWVMDENHNRALVYGASTFESDNDGGDGGNDGNDSGSDADNDGLSDSIEDAGPNGGDANNDGTPDSQQSNVTSIVNPVNGSYAVLQSSCANHTNVSVSAEDSSAKDPGFDYPAGLMNFTLNCGVNGTAATITQYYYGITAEGLVLRKFHSINKSYQQISGAVLTNETIGGLPAVKAVYQITDGSELDEDATVNGVIVDPSGLARLAVGAPETGLGGSWR